MINFYVIYKKDDISCEEYLRDCQVSAEYYNISTIPNPGVYDNITELLKKEHLFLQTNLPGVITTEPKQGCFLSHYFLWKKCVALNKPIGVFEYDAVVVRPLPDNILDTFSDWLNLDINRHHHDQKTDGYYERVLTPSKLSVCKFYKCAINQAPKRTQHIRYMFNSAMRGTHAYIIKPHAAQTLIDAAKSEGILSSDLMASSRYIELEYTVPSLTCINPRMWNNRNRQSHTITDPKAKR